MMWSNLISNDKLVSAPDFSESISVWTDYCELQCLSSDLQKVDHDQLCDLVIKSYDFKSGDESRQKNKKERLTSRIKDVYAHLLLRNELLSDKYPFEIDSDDQICLKDLELTDVQRLYVLLLCASNLKYTKQTVTLTSDFEVLSLFYMRKLFPEMVFRLFGSSNVNDMLCDGDLISDVKLKDRIVSLSKFISVACDNEIIGRLSDHDLGDGGLDLVGIRDMGDSRKSIPVMFGQCACSRDEWSNKQQSISDAQWKKFLKTWTTSIQNYIFIPIWYMNSDKQFENELKVTSCIVVDRLRMMSVVDGSFLSKCCSLNNCVDK